jgi:hypothetical protein
MQPGIILIAAPVYTVIMCIALVATQLLTSPALWLGVCGLHFLRIVFNYRDADNHLYLEGYWCLAIAAAFFAGSPEGEAVLAKSANGLIALCFLLSVYAKIRSPSFLNGSFFTYTLIFDKRFVPVLYRSGISPDTMLAHHYARLRMISGKAAEEKVPVPAPLRRLAIGLTYWTIAIEAAVGVLFCFPVDGLMGFRFLGLVIFAITTYLLVPVPTFGMTLLLMFATTTQDIHFRIAALLLMAVMPIAAPFSQLFGTILLLKTRASLPNPNAGPAPTATTQQVEARLAPNGAGHPHPSN